MGYDHKPIDNCPFVNYLGLRLMYHGLTLIVSFFFLVQTSFRKFWGGGFGHVEVGLGMYA